MIARVRSTGTAVFALVFAVLNAGWPESAPAARVQSYVIDAVFEPQARRMRAVVDVRFVPGTVTGDTLVFFLHGELRVDSFEVAGRSVDARQGLVFNADDYSSVANRIEVDVQGVDLSGGVRVGYGGLFNPSVVRAPSNYMRIDGEGVYLRSLGYSLWFPMFVQGWKNAYDVAFPHVTLRTPADFTAVFTGDLVRRYERDGMAVSEWKADRASLFDAQCTARRYDISSDGEIRLYHLQDPVAREKAGEIAAFVNRLQSLYEAHYRSGVAVSQLHILQMPKYGDISSGNVIGISDAVWNRFEPTAWQGRTVAHELVHPFVAVPHSDEMGALVVEGFPSYFYLPALAAVLGEQWYRDYIAGIEQAYVQRRATGENRRGEPLPAEKAIMDISYDEIGVYKDRFVLNDRVKLFFDYLRRRMGSERFLDFATDLLNREMLDYAALASAAESYLPGCGDDIRRWLTTTGYPDEFKP
jgi:hypothetical protein